ncbi:MAG TPA: ribosome small subunit-dependent GTPase A [Firmicutes bacterium]|nr:ribosome small subunit-dependent GTPase A [Bacillota bacterium]
MDGIVVAKSFNQFMVLAEKRTFRCQMPKTLRNKLVAWPGDFVNFNKNSQMIEEVFPRTKLLARPRIANLEQLFIVMSIEEPLFSWPLVYRYLSYAKFNDIKPLLVISKVDKMLENLEPSFEVQLRHLNIPVFYTSKYKNDSLDRLRDYLSGKISAFAGQSGVGKSSLINEICPDYKQTIGTYSKALGRGRHETKGVTLFPFEDGFIADTPGFSSLELEFGKRDLAMAFPGFEQLALGCKFPHCLHQNEAGCLVIRHVKDGKIPLEAYHAYLELLAPLPHRKESY